MRVFIRWAENRQPAQSADDVKRYIKCALSTIPDG